jgi:hypothetical protein
LGHLAKWIGELFYSTSQNVFTSARLRVRRVPEDAHLRHSRFMALRDAQNPGDVQERVWAVFASKTAHESFALPLVAKLVDVPTARHFSFHRKGSIFE